MALGSQVRHYREGLRWTLEKLSEKSGVDIGTIGALEKRNSSRSQYGVKLASAFGLTVEQLLDDGTDYLAQIKAGGPIAPTSAHHLRESAPPWPFRNLTAADWWDTLDGDARMLVEAYARGMLDSSRARPKKIANG